MTSRRLGFLWYFLLAALLFAGCLAPPTPTPTIPVAEAVTPTVTAIPPTPTAAEIAQKRTSTPFPPTATPTAEPTATLTPTSTFTPAPEQSVEAERVLIISVDGLRPDALSEDVSPHVMALAEAGAYTWQAQTVLPSVTLVSHASMLSGVPPAQHGVTWNDFRPTAGVIQAPTVFSVAHSAGRRTVMLFGKTKLLHLVSPGAVDEVLNLASHGDWNISRRAAELISDGFGVMFVHLPGVDGAGHAAGWMSERYLSAVTAADEAIGHMLGALEAAGLTETTAVIVNADHGGKGRSHGRDIPEDRTIPWVIAGPGVRAGHELGASVTVMDTAATALYVLDMDVPAGWEGRPVTEAFGTR